VLNVALVSQGKGYPGGPQYLLNWVTFYGLYAIGAAVFTDLGEIWHGIVHFGFTLSCKI